MLPRIAALCAALLGLLALPAAAGANPAVAVEVVSTTNLSKVPATVMHRLSLTAGATDEPVRISAAGNGMQLGGSVPATTPVASAGPSVAACPGRWDALRLPDTSSWTTELTIPAGTTATVTVPVRTDMPLRYDETLSTAFEVTPRDGRPYEVRSQAPSWTGPLVPEMTLFVLRGANRTTVLTGEAVGPSSGLVEIWGFAPRTTKARRLKTVRVDEDGHWSWAGFRPRARGTWELYTRYRRTARSTRTGATECGLQFRVG
jgi:hypothetical protein